MFIVFRWIVIFKLLEVLFCMGCKGDRLFFGCVMLLLWVVIIIILFILIFIYKMRIIVIF